MKKRIALVILSLILLLITAIVLRIIWIFSVKTEPISDFASMLEAAKLISIGDFSRLKGHEYLSRFPHLIPMSFYMAGIVKIFPIHNLIVMKLINVFLSVISGYLLYKLSDNFIKSERNKLFVLLMSSLFPPFITYTSVLCTENLAIPLYIGTLIVFYKALNTKHEKQWKYFLISGVLLSFSDLFRGVAIVFLIAFLIYLLICTESHKLKNTVSLILGYTVITFSISLILMMGNIIERPLWQGMEPSSATLLLKGTNFESGGMWTVEDADFVEKHLK